jgi:hypothetical protein
MRFDRSVFEREAQKNLLEHLRLVGLTAALGREGGAARAEGTAVGTVLYHLLCDKRRQSLDRAFRALQLAHEGEDLASVHAALVRGDKRARASARELVEILPIGTREARELFLLVADDLEPSDLFGRARDALAAQLDATSVDPHAGPEHAIELLLDDRDDFVAALAAHHALDSGVIALARRARAKLGKRPPLEKFFTGPQKETVHAR